MEELIKNVIIDDEVRYEIYKVGKKFVVVDYFKEEVNGESIPLMEYEIEKYSLPLTKNTTFITDKILFQIQNFDSF